MAPLWQRSRLQLVHAPVNRLPREAELPSLLLWVWSSPAGVAGLCLGGHVANNRQARGGYPEPVPLLSSEASFHPKPGSRLFQLAIAESLDCETSESSETFLSSGSKEPPSNADAAPRTIRPPS